MARDPLAPPLARMPRGRCPVCGCDVPLRVGNLTRDHGRGNRMLPADQGGYRPCSGAGKPALEIPQWERDIDESW